MRGSETRIVVLNDGLKKAFGIQAMESFVGVVKPQEALEMLLQPTNEDWDKQSAEMKWNTIELRLAFMPISVDKTAQRRKS